MSILDRTGPLGRALSRLVQVLGTCLLLSTLVVGDALAQGGRPPAPPTRPVPVRHQPPPRQGKKVEVEVMVVYATNSGNRVDPDLQPVMQQLRFTRYRSFTRLETHPATLDVGGDAQFNIAGDRQVRVELVSRDDDKAKIRMQMFNQGGKLLDTTVSIHRNRSFMIAGPRYEEGVLILPVTVRY